MSSGRSSSTTLAAIVLTLLGFVGGAAGAAWVKRDQRTEPWRAMRVDHRGVHGETTRTRVIFDDPKVALQGVELIRNPQGLPELGRAEIRGAEELTVYYERGRRPSSLEGTGGVRAVFTYKGSKARVMFMAADGRELGNEVVTVPVALRSPLQLSHNALKQSVHALPASVSAASGLGELLLGELLLGEAHAQAAKPSDKPAEDAQVVVTREVRMLLNVAIPGESAQPGQARLEASCAPLTCLPQSPTVQVPGDASARIVVTASAERSQLGPKPSDEALAPFKKLAAEEREVALEVLPDVAAVVAIVGVTASACKALNQSWPVCVAKLNRATTTGAALHSLASYQPPDVRLLSNERATELYYQEQARAQLDKPVALEVCLSREGFAPACTKVDGRPLGAAPMAAVQRNLELRRGIAGTLTGSYEMTQADGADCNFSPSPKTLGPLTLSFADKTGVITAKFSANARGTRTGLRCSLGSGDMRWSQIYSATLTQTVPLEQLRSGGSLALHLRGTMSGSGSASQSNCRSSTGASAGCPGGRSSTYSYPIEITGNLDLRSKIGSGTISVSKAPLSTRGSWHVPAKATP